MTKPKNIAVKPFLKKASNQDSVRAELLLEKSF